MMGSTASDSAWSNVPVNLEEWPRHECNAGLDVSAPKMMGYGSAVHTIVRSSTGQWWAFGGFGEEYASPISYCPYCGQRL